MSSATQFNPKGVKSLISNMMDKVRGTAPGNNINYENLARLGMSPRQQELNHLWAWYRAEHYNTRAVGWDGRETVDPIEHEAIASQTSIPPGFVDFGQSYPIKFRKPTAPYSLGRVIVDRFTSMLFSARHHPYIYVEADVDTNDYIGAMIETSRLWPAMMLARQYGGAMGSVCMGFQFINGKPEVEVHDPRWTLPDFEDRSTFRLRKIEKRYMYPQEERGLDGRYQAVWYWYRRVITTTQDTLYAPALVGDGSEPEWEVSRQTNHNFGFCPCVWIQNLPVQDDIDGDPDCHGIFDMIEAMDALMSQANKGVTANCDPTLVISSEAELGGVSKGSENAIKLERGDSATYLELGGSGPDAAVKLFDMYRKCALEVAQCVLDHPDAQNRTATEIERWYSGMLSKGDIFREQYGQRGVLALVEMMVIAARQLGEGKVDSETGELVRDILLLPPRAIENEDGTVSMQDRKLGPGGIIGIRWQRYFEYTLADIELAVRAAGAAIASGLLDMESAVRFVAEYFGIVNVQALVTKLLAAKAKAKTDTESEMFSYLKGEVMPKEEETP